MLATVCFRCRRKLLESATSGPVISGRTRRRCRLASPENFRRAMQAKKGRHADAIPNNLRDKSSETKPTDEKARESG